MLVTFTQLISSLFDGLLWPVRDSPHIGLVWIAVLLGLLVGYLMRWLTPRNLLNRLAEQAKSELLAIRLFADQPGSCFRSLTRLLLFNLARVACFVPAIVLLLPVGLLVESQLEMRFARRPILPGETAVVKLKFSSHVLPAHGEVQMSIGTVKAGKESELKNGFTIAGPLYDLSDRAIYWQIQRGSETQGYVHLQQIDWTFSNRAEHFSIPLFLASKDSHITPILDRVRDTKPADSLTISYPTRGYRFAGINQPWWIMFLFVFCATAWAVGLRRA